MLPGIPQGQDNQSFLLGPSQTRPYVPAPSAGSHLPACALTKLGPSRSPFPSWELLCPT